MRIFCNYCGAANTSDSPTCYACATPLVAASSSPSIPSAASAFYPTAVPDAVPGQASVPHWPSSMAFEEQPASATPPVGPLWPGYVPGQPPYTPSQPTPNPASSHPTYGYQPAPYPVSVPQPLQNGSAPMAGSDRWYSASGYPVPVTSYPLLPAGGRYVGLAEAGPRVGAYLLDSFALGVPLFLLLMLVGATGSSALAGLWLLLSFAGPAAYFITAWATTGRTLGYRAMGLQLVRTDGTQPGLGPAVARYIGLLLSLIVLVPGLLGLMWMLWDDRKQAWHDKIADTVVIRS